ncbi:acyl-CoA thioesterase [Pseudomonas sp. JQ170]|uniref:acyl-CoA thioesterase n=1 Tax=unclassified Pseudomonas TaxID=196821 RepID=UPI000FAE77A5|nr:MULTISPECIES: thioesterase family protein [unclassified Pseudomonas]MDN7139814.1 acyl-CoA thioesterase [Pseudomonas sp. JQ170]WRO73732.1 thioesterase family protein [Pseudomonas sp. 170C]
MSRKAYRPRREDFRYSYTVGTRWADHDSYGHVQNIVYYSFFDSAISHFLVGQGTLDIGNSPVIGLIVESSCTFLSPITFPDDVTVGLRITHLGNSSARYELGVFRNDEDEACALGYVVYVYVDRSSNAPVAIPRLIRDELLRLVD